jgi:MFS family permease
VQVHEQIGAFDDLSAQRVREPLGRLAGGVARERSGQVQAIDRPALYLGRIADKRGKLPVFTISVVLSLFMVLIITRMPTVPFAVVLVFFACWFIFATGRAVTAQAMISEVVRPEQRGSFMSFNGCVQQLGTSIASVAAGFIVLKDSSGKIQRYEWLGYLSIVVLVVTLVIGRYLFRNIDKSEEQVRMEREFLNEPIVES